MVKFRGYGRGFRVKHTILIFNKCVVIVSVDHSCRNKYQNVTLLFRRYIESLQRKFQFVGHCGDIWYATNEIWPKKAKLLRWFRRHRPRGGGGNILAKITKIPVKPETIGSSNTLRSFLKDSQVMNKGASWPYIACQGCAGSTAHATITTMPTYHRNVAPPEVVLHFSRGLKMKKGR